MCDDYKEIRHIKEYSDGSGIESSVTVSERYFKIEFRGDTLEIDQEFILWFIENIISSSNELDLLKGKIND